MHALDEIVEGIINASVEVKLGRDSSNNPVINGIYHADKDAIKDTDFNFYITSQPWMKEQGIKYGHGVGPKRNKLFFTKGMLKERPFGMTYRELALSSNKETSPALREPVLVILDMDGPNHLSRAVLLPKKGLDGKGNSIYEDSAQLVLTQHPDLKDSQRLIFNTLKELYSLDDKNPVEALRKYKEKHPY